MAGLDELTNDGEMKDADRVGEAFSQTRCPLNSRAFALVEEEGGDGDDAADERVAEIGGQKKKDGHHGAVHPVDRVNIKVHPVTGTFAALHRRKVFSAIHRPTRLRFQAEQIGE